MQTKQYPFYIKSTVILFGLVLLTYSLINMKQILSPLAFAIIISILLNPLVNRLNKWGIKRILAIIVSLLIAITVITALFYFLSSQIAGFSDSFPALQKKMMMLSGQLHEWLKNNFGMDMDSQSKMVDDVMNAGKAMLGKTVGGALGMLGVILIMPVYIFLILFYKTLILNFLYEVFAEENSTKVNSILTQTKSAIQSYMVGLLLEALVVAILNSTALLILGVDYAILLGVLGALLNMLPYIGGLVAIALPVLIATVTKDGYSTQLGIIIAYAIIQFLDNNILVPKLVSSKVQINALFSIVVVLLGGALWGVAGMFLSIPTVAILKIIFDRIDDLKPWGKLLGDTVPTRHKGHVWMRRSKKGGAVTEEIVVETKS